MTSLSQKLMVFLLTILGVFLFVVINSPLQAGRELAQRVRYSLRDLTGHRSLSSSEKSKTVDRAGTSNGRGAVSGRAGSCVFATNSGRNDRVAVVQSRLLETVYDSPCSSLARFEDAKAKRKTVFNVTFLNVA